MIEMVVFDMAGTVIDEHNIVYKTLHQSLLNAGVVVDYETVLLHGAGKEKKQALIDILKLLNGSYDLALTDQCYRNFRESLATAYLENDISAQPGAEEIFEFLHEKGIVVVLNTGYDRATAEHLIDKLQWRVGEHIDYLVTASDVFASRPSPEMIQLAMQQFRIRHAYFAIKVGDSIVDIEEGRNGDCRYVIGITTGAHTREQLMQAEPTHIIDHLTELRKIVDDCRNN